MAEAIVEVDHDVCIVSGMCASLAPEIFDIDDDGLRLEVLQPSLTPELADKARNAEACCPVSAIKVTEKSP
ncbi:MAG: ferredoxin [Acidimicrobiaceae bacterium]|nr:ferredoxin [Acidimicrobiaceae bacterium]MCY4176404.1 ferredoxin [Acidimicrobiaceae bacterium]MCY4280531.1 ferredoxin [Acidimicrobiaceae bacterium]MCY4294278.1 ferredoxin [Acidimicrobiaceae bacterium]